MTELTISVSDIDTDLLYQTTCLYIGVVGYVVGENDVMLHLQIAKRMGLTIADGYVIDHIDGNKLNNRRDNLRAISNTDNIRSRHCVNANNSSGYAGVSFVRRSDASLKKPWMAKITVNRKQIALGYYVTKEEAASAYAAVAEFAFGEFCPSTILPATLRIKTAEVAGLSHYHRVTK